MTKQDLIDKLKLIQGNPVLATKKGNLTIICSYIKLERATLDEETLMMLDLDNEEILIIDL